MQIKKPYPRLAHFTGIITVLLFCFITIPPAAFSQEKQISFSAKELDKLVEPIALYPDNLIAVMLPASTFPDQIIDATLQIKSEKDANLIAKQTWDDSVKVVSTYPGILKMMYDKMPWTMDLGKAFLAQHREVLDAIQRMRGKAYAEGELQSNEQQVVSTAKAPDGDTVITLEPASHEVIYVPTDDDDDDNSDALVPLVSFGLGMALGASFDDDDDDHYYYGGWGGPGYWHNENVEHWIDHRNEVWDDYNKRKADRQEFRQDMVSSGKWSPGQGQQAQQRADTWRQNNPEKSQQLASARSSGTSLRDSGNYSRTHSIKRPESTYRPSTTSSVNPVGRDLYPRASTNNPFQNYAPRSTTSGYSNRGSYSRGSSSFGSRGGGSFGARAGGGGFRGGGGRGGRR